ncbi:MAG: hypothetical protein NTY53_22345 [Kiritimatiellaeota bacterium]|nr:hypothetical protein [Kiritimatiellota bacterium]
MAALVLYAAAGCVRVPAESEKNKIVTQLITATANGLTILRWETRPDLEYTILTADRFNAVQWKPLENGKNLRGSGEPIELRVSEDPNHPRTYKLLAVPVQPTGTKR